MPGNNTLTFGGGGHGVSVVRQPMGLTIICQAISLPMPRRIQNEIAVSGHTAIKRQKLFDKTYYTSSIATNNLGNQIAIRVKCNSR